ncbi:MAG: hypothetical protein KY429_03835 [Actinobacteria bacterium]|nr:hypothetical protein [Actinomycetota bacterium]
MLRPLIIAHKGASKRAPENTLEAFKLARELGADWLDPSLLWPRRWTPAPGWVSTWRSKAPRTLD